MQFNEIDFLTYIKRVTLNTAQTVWNFNCCYHNTDTNKQVTNVAEEIQSTEYEQMLQTVKLDFYVWHNTRERQCISSSLLLQSSLPQGANYPNLAELCSE